MYTKGFDRPTGLRGFRRDRVVEGWAVEGWQGQQKRVASDRAWGALGREPQHGWAVLIDCIDWGECLAPWARE